MSMFRNIPEDGTVEIWINTVDTSGAPVAPSSAFTASDFAIHKDGAATEKATTNGLTVTSPFDSETGLHLLVIDTSNDTGDAGFWTTGSRYAVRFDTAKTVDSVSIDGRLVPQGQFGIESEYMRGTDSANTTTPLDAAGVRSAVGMSAANLDTQLTTIDGNVDDVLTNLAVVDGIVDAILVDTGTSIPATLVTIASDADTAATEATANGVTLTNAFPTNFASLLINGSGHLSRVTLVDTTTTNTDMVSGFATATELAKVLDRTGYTLTVLAGAVSDAQTAAAEYTLTLDGNVHTVTYAGLTSAGVRTAPTLSKA